MLVATATWKVKSFGYVPSDTPPTIYTKEIKNNNNIYEAKIGLMYISDYVYGASTSAWTLIGKDNDDSKCYTSASSINWLYLDSNEWTISSYYSSVVFSISSYGSFGGYKASSFSHQVRPTGYLISSITYLSGSGTSSDPIRIN